MSTITVIGGGIGGLATTYYLSKLANSQLSKIILLEGSNRLGGWLNTTRLDDGSVLEHGPRSFRIAGSEGVNTLKLAEELGLDSAVVKVPSRRVQRILYIDGKLHRLPKDFKGLSLWNISQGAIKDLFMTRETDESIESFFKKRFEKVPEMMTAVNAMARGIYAGDIRELSVNSCFSFIRDSPSLLQFLRSNAKENRKYRESSSSLVKRAHSEKWAAWTLQNGTQQLVDKITEVIQGDPRVDIRKETMCQRINFDKDSVQVNTNSDEGIVHCDHVVSSIYSKYLGHLLPTTHKELSGFLGKIPAVSVIVVNVLYDKDLATVPKGFGHLLPSTEDPSVLGVIYDSCVFPEHDRKSSPSTRLTLMLGGAWYSDLKKRIGDLDDDEKVIKFSLDILQQQLQISDTPSYTKVARQMDCIPQYLVGHGQLVQDIESYISQHHLPMTLVGSSYRGVAVNGIIYDAYIQSAKILYSLS